MEQNLFSALSSFYCGVLVQIVLCLELVLYIPSLILSF